MIAVCVVCGRQTDLVLAAHIPHICQRCLFPSHVVLQAGEVAPDMRQHRNNRWIP